MESFFKPSVAKIVKLLKSQADKAKRALKALNAGGEMKVSQSSTNETG
jgi:hypothetical protein